MAETLIANEGSEIAPIDLETIRNRFKELSEIRAFPLDLLTNAPNLDRSKLLEDCALDYQRKIEQVESDDLNIAALAPEDLEAYIEQLKNELHAAQDENLKASQDIDALTKAISKDMAQYHGDLEALSCLLNAIESKDQQFDEIGTMAAKAIPADLMDECDYCKFKILELSERIQRSTSNINALQDLDCAFKRMEAIGQIEELLSDVKVISFEDNCIRLLLKTPIPIIDSSLQHYSVGSMEPSLLDHELIIEVVNKEMELKHLEIFPADVYVDNIIHITKSMRHRSAMVNGSPLGWLVREVQNRILLCTIRSSLVKDANKSRYSFEYSDRDETVIVHMVGGIDAFLKASQGWPLSNAALTLISMKSSHSQSRSISLSFLCKDIVNSVDMQRRRHLMSFVDAIEEILVQEMRCEP